MYEHKFICPEYHVKFSDQTLSMSETVNLSYLKGQSNLKTHSKSFRNTVDSVTYIGA